MSDGGYTLNECPANPPESPGDIVPQPRRCGQGCPWIGGALTTGGFSSPLTGEFLTQGRVAEAANVSEVTVRNRYRDLDGRVL